MTFIENYSFGRSSILFLDYRDAYALFINCTFTRNYAYLGGNFYTSYYSTIEIVQSLIEESFALIGAVVYVNNNGKAILR